MQEITITCKFSHLLICNMVKIKTFLYTVVRNTTLHTVPPSRATPSFPTHSSPKQLPDHVSRCSTPEPAETGQRSTKARGLLHSRALGRLMRWDGVMRRHGDLSLCHPLLSLCTWPSGGLGPGHSFQLGPVDRMSRSGAEVAGGSLT